LRRQAVCHASEEGVGRIELRVRIAVELNRQSWPSGRRPKVRGRIHSVGGAVVQYVTGPSQPSLHSQPKDPLRRGNSRSKNARSGEIAEGRVQALTCAGHGHPAARLLHR
jgi:hypothetical protein